MHVVGGTYRERCIEGNWDQLFGSGLRGAAAMSRFGLKVTLSTFLDKDTSRLAHSIAKVFSIDMEVVESQEVVSFSYIHGLDTPHISRSEVSPCARGGLHVSADNVLQFGMLEGDALVHAKRVVYDPQSANAPQPFRASGSQADEVAVVCNRREASILTNRCDAVDAAKCMLEARDADVVIVKCGSEGAVVVTPSGVDSVPVFQTPRVWKIGSGDVFAAAFSKAWAVDSLKAIDAALFASKATAYYCSTQSLPLLPAVELEDWIQNNGIYPLEFPKSERCKTVYLAGPFFNMMERWQIEQGLQALRHQGLRVFSPLHDVGVGDAVDVVPKDINAIVNCDLMFAMLDHLDSGTLFEVGYARSIGKPVIGFCQNETSESLKMLSGSGCLIFDDFVTAIYHAAWTSRS